MRVPSAPMSASERLPDTRATMMSSSSRPPPQYILLSHSNVSSPLASQFNTPPTLSHPIIRYHFKDDPSLSFDLADNARVLIMDYDPDSVYVQSLSSQLAVTSLKVTDAPGAVNDDNEQRNNKMYVIETVSHCSDKDNGATPDEVPATIWSFRQRNALLRKALEYPLPSETTKIDVKHS